MKAEQNWPYNTEDPWERALLDDPSVAVHAHLGSWFLYRPGRLVVDSAVLSHDDLGREIQDLLDKAGAAPVGRDDARPHGERRECDAREAEAAKALGLVLYSVHTHTNDPDALPNLVRELRRVAPDAASLNHVLVADPHRIGGSTPPVPAPKPADVPGTDLTAGAKIRIAVIDTGLDERLHLATAAPSDAEIPDSDGDKILDPAAGHGTFVTGIVRRFAPGADVSVHRALLGAAGIASDLEVAAAILAVPSGVDLVNCSFGGASQDDAPPLAIARALATLDPKTVVVCAAGNQNEQRPHWPAAFKGVYAIAAIDRENPEGIWAASDYTNSGWWIDACAPGTDVHSTFLHFHEHAGLLRRFEHGACWSGTSFSTPTVVGLIARLASHEGISASEAAYRLIDEPNLARLPDLGTVVVP